MVLERFLSPALCDLVDNAIMNMVQIARSFTWRRLRPGDSAPLLGHAPPLDPRLLPLPPLPGNGGSRGRGFAEGLPCSTGCSEATCHPPSPPSALAGPGANARYHWSVFQDRASFYSEIPQPPRVLVTMGPLLRTARPAGGQCPHLTTWV